MINRRYKSVGSSTTVFTGLVLLSVIALIAILAAAKTNNSELEALKSDIKITNSEIAILNAKISEKEESVNTLKNIVKSIESENTELQSVNDKLKEQNNRLLNEMNSTRPDLQEASNPSVEAAENVAAENLLKLLNISNDADENKKLEAVTAIKTKLDEYENLTVENRILENKVDKLRDLESQYLKAVEAASTNFEKVNELTAENKKLKTDLSALKQDKVMGDKQKANVEIPDTPKTKSEPNIKVTKKTTSTVAVATATNKTKTAESTPELQSELDALAPELRNNLTFASGSAWVNFTARSTLDKVAQLLAQRPNSKMTISGHTDQIGNEDINLKLSKRRAEQVREYLITKNVKPEQLDAKGFGSSKPLSTKDLESGRINRRVEFTAD